MSDALKGFIRLQPSAHRTLPLVKTDFIKPEWIDEGRADEQGHFFYNNDDRNVQVGFWECTPFRETISFPYDELGIVIEGRLKLVDAAGRADIFAPGDLFFIPRGQTTTWHILDHFKQYYMIYAPRETQYYRF
jgi:uncharacterized cupin superfamily protein